MDSIDTRFIQYFNDLPAEPMLSLRGGNARDEYREVPEYDPVTDKLSPDYLEAYCWGLPHLDAVSWRYYLPFLLGYAIQNISNPRSNMVETLLSSLRPPDRDPPRFGSLTASEQDAVVTVLDSLAFSDDSVWKDAAMLPCCHAAMLPCCHAAMLPCWHWRNSGHQVLYTNK